jgi:vacuolar protein sorting-associated protein 13A/C
LSDAPIFLKGILLYNIYGFSDEVVAQLTTYYMDEMKPCIAGLLGSSDLIGNPNQLRKDLGSGFTALTTMPKEGFEQGLVEGTFGVVKGTAELAKYSVGGAAGSLSRFTTAVNKPLSMLSFDDGFIA